MGVISNGTTLLDAGALDSGVATGDMVLIKTLTASSSSDLTFVHGTSSVVFDGTYKEYQFHIINAHPQTDNTILQIGFRDGSSNYDAPIMTTYFAAQNRETDASASLGYNTDQDETNSTGDQNISEALGADADQGASGVISIFEPASTSKVKHFTIRMAYNHQNDRIMDAFSAGYCNTTTAIDAIRFKMSSGNIDSGTFKLYGIKPS